MKNRTPESKNHEQNEGLTRRRFLESTVGTTVASAMAGSLLTHANANANAHAHTHTPATAADVRNGIPYRTLGNTGEKVSCVGLGGYHLGRQSDVQESIRIVRTGLDEGINFLDNCWDYNGGDLNLMDAHFNSFEKQVLPVLLKNDIGVLAMKPMGDRIILESKTANPVECLHYAMNLPTSVVITGCDSLPILEQALEAARGFQPMRSSQVAALLARTAKAAEAGQFELYKTTHRFDGTVANPQWLG